MNNISDQLHISPSIQNALIETTKWSKFLAIIGFIGLAFLLILALVIPAVGSAVKTTQTMNGLGSSSTTAVSPVVLSVVYLILVVLYFFPLRSLYRFSTKTRNSMINGYQGDFENGIDELRKHYKLVGIYTIIVLSFYLLVFLIAIFFGIGQSFGS